MSSGEHRHWFTYQCFYPQELTCLCYNEGRWPYLKQFGISNIFIFGGQQSTRKDYVKYELQSEHVKSLFSSTVGD